MNKGSHRSSRIITEDCFWQSGVIQHEKFHGPQKVARRHATTEHTWISMLDYGANTMSTQSQHRTAQINTDVTRIYTDQHIANMDLHGANTDLDGAYTDQHGCNTIIRI